MTGTFVKRHELGVQTGLGVARPVSRGGAVSARGRGHLLRVARTIADLEGSDFIKPAHVAEAVQYAVREHEG